MKNAQHDAERWLRQAENDLAFARTGLENGFYAQTCFLAQQVGEKAVKAIHYARGERIVYGHSIYDLFKRLKLKDKDAGSLLQIAGSLDQFYIPARYPNGLPEAAPFEVYTKKQAEEAIEGAAKLIALAERVVRKL